MWTTTSLPAAAVDLPEVDWPIAEPAGADDELTVVDSSWTFAEQAERLLAQKAYAFDGDDDEDAA